MIGHWLRQSGYDPDRWRHDLTVLLIRLMRLYSWLALATIAVATVLAATSGAYAAAKTGNADFLAAGDVDALQPFIDKLRIWLVRPARIDCHLVPRRRRAAADRRGR